MKAVRLLVMVCALLFGASMYGTAFAQAPDATPPYKAGAWGHDHHKRGGPMLVNRMVAKNIMLQALSQQTGKPAEELKQEIKSKGIRAVLDEYKVDRKALHSAIRAKSEAVIKLLADNGYLTPEQSKEVIEHINKQEERHELMTRLIDSGLKQGTITQDQAKLLRPWQH